MMLTSTCSHVIPLAIKPKQSTPIQNIKRQWQSKYLYIVIWYFNKCVLKKYKNHWIQFRSITLGNINKGGIMWNWKTETTLHTGINTNIFLKQTEPGPYVQNIRLPSALESSILLYSCGLQTANRPTERPKEQKQKKEKNYYYHFLCQNKWTNIQFFPAILLPLSWLSGSGIGLHQQALAALILVLHYTPVYPV